jgi:Spy/CpxP family protein refolding chaperone
MESNPYFSRFIVASCHALGLPASALARFVADREPTGLVPFGRPPPLRALDLAESQREQIFRLFHEQAPLLRERLKIAERTRGQLESLWADPNFDRARARQFARAHGDAVAEIAMVHAETIGRVRRILTPKQLARLDAVRERRYGPGPPCEPVPDRSDGSNRSCAPAALGSPSLAKRHEQEA